MTVKVAKALIVKYKYTNPLIETLQEEQRREKILAEWIFLVVVFVFAAILARKPTRGKSII